MATMVVKHTEPEVARSVTTAHLPAAFQQSSCLTNFRQVYFHLEELVYRQPERKTRRPIPVMPIQGTYRAVLLFFRPSHRASALVKNELVSPAGQFRLYEMRWIPLPGWHSHIPPAERPMRLMTDVQFERKKRHPFVPTAHRLTFRNIRLYFELPLRRVARSELI